jgi:glycosyltransferase involved in cell wall biosynthesis
MQNRLKRLKIAYFQQDGLLTGSAISLRHFLSALNRDIFEPVVVLAEEGPARSLYESLNIPVLINQYNTFWTFPGPRCFSRGMIRQFRALIPNPKLKSFVLNELKPDLIHINDKAALNVGVSLKGSGIPIVQHSRSTYLITACKWGKYLSAKTIKGFANHIVCISEDEEDGFETFQKRSIIYNTVDFDLIKKARAERAKTRQKLLVNDDEYLIGFAAHVSEKKGAWDFLELCSQLKQNSKLKFILAGKIEERGSTSLDNGQILPISAKAYVTSYIKKHKLEKQLIVTGFREDILELIAAMDVLVVPNKNGVLGRQPIEAQALGTAVIAQAGHSKRSRIVQHGTTGYLINNIQEGIEQIKQLQQSKSFEKISRTAQHYAEQNFTPATNMRKLEKIYLNLLKH